MTHIEKRINSILYGAINRSNDRYVEPESGSIRWGVIERDLRDVVNDAVKAEREACAKIADCEGRGAAAMRARS